MIMNIKLLLIILVIGSIQEIECDPTWGILTGALINDFECF